MPDKPINKVVLAYSGGLDTSVILKWLQDQYDCEVVTFTADIGQGEELEPARSKAEQMAVREIYIDDCYSLEVRHQQADKSIMISRLCQLVGCSEQDVTYFGDQQNDLEIFDVVGTSVAVDNASAEVKAKANLVIESNQSDGVAKYLNQVFKVEL